jgi:hypothetical protein
MKMKQKKLFNMAKIQDDDYLNKLNLNENINNMNLIK